MNKSYDPLEIYGAASVQPPQDITEPIDYAKVSYGSRRDRARIKSALTYITKIITSSAMLIVVGAGVLYLLKSITREQRMTAFIAGIAVVLAGSIIKKIIELRIYSFKTVGTIVDYEKKVIPNDDGTDSIVYIPKFSVDYNGQTYLAETESTLSKEPYIGQRMNVLLDEKDPSSVYVPQPMILEILLTIVPALFVALIAFVFNMMMY